MIVLSFPATFSFGEGTVDGHFRIPKVTGHQELGYVELYEFNAYLCPDGTGTGQSQRTGAVPGQPITHDGWFHFTNVPAGRYSLIVTNQVFWPRVAISPNILVSDGQTTTVNPEPQADYVVTYNNPAEWGSDPWRWGATIEQTFVATGTMITQFSFRLVASDAQTINVSFHDSTGTQIGPTRQISGPSALGDTPAGFHYGEVPTVPGNPYFIRLHDANGNAAMGIVRRNDNGTGYGSGYLRVDGVDYKTEDGAFYIAGDGDGILTTYNNIWRNTSARDIFANADGDIDWSSDWGQTWIARGTSLAGLEMFYASPGGAQQYTVTIHQGGPGGAQIGPAKTQEGRSLAAASSFVAVSYNTGEVPLTPGQTYFARINHSGGYNAYYIKYDSYPSGGGYVHNGSTWVAANHNGSQKDLDLGIYEYKSSTPAPTFTPTPTQPGNPSPTRTPTRPPGTPGPNVLCNANFEGMFNNGVAECWSPFQVSGTGFWKPNELLGRLGGGIYGCFGPSGVEGYDCLDEYQSERMSAKSYLISLDRYNQARDIPNHLGIEVITIAKFDAETLDYPDGDTWPNNAEADGARWADYYYNQWIRKRPDVVPDAFYGLNEPSVNVAEHVAKVAKFELGFTRRMHELGFKAIVMNNSVGTPANINDFLLPEVKELFEMADYIGYHNYGEWGTGWMCRPAANPYTFRWQQIANLYIQRGWRFPPVIYTESGHYSWEGTLTPQQVRDDLICYEARERNEEWWSLGINYFVTGAWPGGWDGFHIGRFPQIIDGCRAANQAHPLDAHSGLQAQEMGGRKQSFDHGIVQQVGTRPGALYEFSGWFKHEFDEGWPRRVVIRVGWDPTGQTSNADAPTVQWSDDLIQLGQNNPLFDGPWYHDLWYQYKSTFRAGGSQGSLWFRGIQTSSSPSSRIYVDDVSLREISGGETNTFILY